MFRTSAISFVIAMIFSSMIGTSFLGKGYHLSGGIGRWGEGEVSKIDDKSKLSRSPTSIRHMGTGAIRVPVVFFRI